MMRYEQVYEKDFVSKKITESLEYHRRLLVDELMARVWDEWVPGTTLEFESKFGYTDKFRDSSLEEMVAELAQKGWTLTFERIGLPHENRFKFSIS